MTAPYARPEWTVRLAATGSALGCAEREVRQVVAAWGLQHVADVVELVALELVSVALGGIEQAGVRPGCRAVCPVRLVSLRFQLDAQGLVVATRDANPHPPRFRQPGTGRSEPGELYYVPMLAEAWDFFPSGSGKVVWCEVAIPSPDGRRLPRRTPIQVSQQTPWGWTAADPYLLERVLQGLRMLDNDQLLSDDPTA